MSTEHEMKAEREKKFLWGTQAIADRYCDGNKRRAEHLINKGVIPVKKFGKLVCGEEGTIEAVLMPETD
jgi:hypothetical protein